MEGRGGEPVVMGGRSVHSLSVVGGSAPPSTLERARLRSRWIARAPPREHRCHRGTSTATHSTVLSVAHWLMCACTPCDGCGVRTRPQRTCNDAFSTLGACARRPSWYRGGSATGGGATGVAAAATCQLRLCRRSAHAGTAAGTAAAAERGRRRRARPPRVAPRKAGRGRFVRERPTASSHGMRADAGRLQPPRCTQAATQVQGHAS